MSVQAHVQDDWMRDGIKVAILLDRGEQGNGGKILQWVQPNVTELTPAQMAPEDAYLSLPNEIARALYEALSVHFGGNVVDATKLRKDYDAERARVDLFIKHLTATR